MNLRETSLHILPRALLPEKLVLDPARETVALFHQFWQAEKANLPLHAVVIEAVETNLKVIPMA